MRKEKCFQNQIAITVLHVPFIVPGGRQYCGAAKPFSGVPSTCRKNVCQYMGSLPGEGLSFLFSENYAMIRHDTVTKSWTNNPKEIESPKGLLDKACIAELYARLSMLESERKN